MPDLLQQIRKSIIGDLQLIKTPFGEKPLVYADYTASGRCLSFIEAIIQRQVMPFYANTHSESSHCGAAVTQLREAARETIHKAVNGSDSHKVIFCGSGTTTAIHKLIDLLKLRQPQDVEDRPVVFLGPYEHHSNEIAWRELDMEVCVVPLNERGEIDTGVLETLLLTHQSRTQKIGSFSAASNVTGIKTDIEEVSRLLKKYGVLNCWDFAAAAPYVSIDMQASDMDVIFFSPHKFVGGPGSPGVLVVNEQCVGTDIPTRPGGGTVSFVSPESQRYSGCLVSREEAGTPDVIGAIRAGLAIKLQQDIGAELIESLESRLVHRALNRLEPNPDVRVLGNPDIDRLAIVSFLISCRGVELPYGLVVTLLNDLFGIQARGGCSCAGPYGHTLLDINCDESHAIDQAVSQGNLSARPGWVRINFNYFIDEATFEYLLAAIELLAEHGDKMLDCYQFDTGNGIWKHSDIGSSRLSLSDIDFELVQDVNPISIASEQLGEYLVQAERDMGKMEQARAI